MKQLVKKIKSEHNFKIFEFEAMKNHTTINSGGVCRLLCIPDSIDDLRDLMALVHEFAVDYRVIGRGSNLLFTDILHEIVVIKISKTLNFLEVADDHISVGAGYSTQQFAKTVSKLGVCGFEFAGGIPGTIGGAIYMNAGAHTSDFAAMVQSVTYMDPLGKIHTINKEQCDFTYRHSIFNRIDAIIVSVCFKKELADKAVVFKRMSGNLEYRKEMQPLDVPSCGSTFKNPPGHHAGKLIEECGLKGYKIGGAQVSEKHANFVVNIDGGSSTDLLDLIELIIKTVKEKKGIDLTAEVEIVGTHE